MSLAELSNTEIRAALIGTRLIDYSEEDLDLIRNRLMPSPGPWSDEAKALHQSLLVEVDGVAIEQAISDQRAAGYQHFPNVYADVEGKKYVASKLLTCSRDPDDLYFPYKEVMWGGFIRDRNTIAFPPDPEPET